MKLIFVSFLIAAACLSAAEEIELSLNGLIEILKLKCERKSGPTAFQELKDTIELARQCVKSADSAKNKNFDDFCVNFDYNPETYKCLTPIGAKLEACLDEEESFLPDFLYGAYNHTLEEFCKPSEQAKLRYLMDIFWHGEECLDHVDGELIGKTCFSELAIFKSANNLDEKTYIVKETEICSDMINLQTCLINSIKEQCDGKDHSKFVHYVLEPFLSWCAKRHA